MRLQNSLDWTGADGATVTPAGTATTGDQMRVIGTPKWSNDPAKQLFGKGGSVEAGAQQRLGWDLPGEVVEGDIFVPGQPEVWINFYLSRDQVLSMRHAKIVFTNGQEGLDFFVGTNVIFVDWIHENGSAETVYFEQTAADWTKPVFVNMYVNADTGHFDVKTYDQYGWAADNFQVTIPSTGHRVATFDVGSYSNGVHVVRLDEIRIDTTGPSEQLGPEITEYDFKYVTVKHIPGSTLDDTFVLDVSSLDETFPVADLPAATVSITQDMAEIEAEVPFKKDTEQFLGASPPMGAISWSEWIDVAEIPKTRNLKKGSRIEILYADPDFPSYVFVGLVRDLVITTSSKNKQGQILQNVAVQLGDMSTTWANTPVELEFFTDADPKVSEKGAWTMLTEAMTKQPRLQGTSARALAYPYANFTYEMTNSQGNIWNKRILGPDPTSDEYESNNTTAFVTKTRLEWIQDYSAATGLMTMIMPSSGHTDMGSLVVTDAHIKFPEHPWPLNALFANSSSWQTSVSFKADESSPNKIRGLVPSGISVVSDSVILTPSIRNYMQITELDWITDPDGFTYEIPTSNATLPQGFQAFSFGLKPGVMIEVPTGQKAVVKSSTITMSYKHLAISAELIDPLEFTLDASLPYMARVATVRYAPLSIR